MTNNVKWESYVEAPKNMSFKDFLFDLNIKYGTNLEILDHDKGFFMETIRFRFSGIENKVAALREEYKHIVLDILKQQHENSFYSDMCKADEVTMTYYPNHLNIQIIASKNEKINQLASNIKEHFNINFDMSHKDNGFLKGQTIIIDMFGSSEQIKLFANIFNKNLECKKQTILYKDAIDNIESENNFKKNKIF